MYLGELQQRLVAAVRERVHAGELTERRLAIICGISQPHVHHVLNHLRTPSIDTADRLMKALGIRVTDLLSHAPALHGREHQSPAFCAVPVVARQIGPGSLGVLSATDGFYPFPEPLVKSLTDPIAARLGPDLLLPRPLAVGDLILLDQNARVRSLPDWGIWVVKEEAGLCARYLRRTDTHLCLANQFTLSDPRRWRSIPVEGHNIVEIVRARIVWIGRQVETEPAGPVDPAGQSY